MRSPILAFIFLTICVTQIVAQTTVTIGSGTTDRWVPYNPYYGYTYSQSIFDQSEIATSGDIDKIRYYFNGNSAFTDNPVNVYIGHTTKSTFSSTTDWIATGAMTLVYSGAVSTTTTAGWVEIDISNFSYNNTDNLVVAVYEAQSGYHSSSDDFYSTACTGNKTIYKYRDTPAIDPAAPPTGSVQAYRPNIQLVFIAATPMTYSSSTVTQGNTTDVYPGLANREIIGVEVVTSGSASPFDVTQFQINMNGSTNGTADVSNIDLYYTGTSNSFATTSLFGSATPAGGTINVNGTQALSNGTNYFWIAYDIDGAATSGNFVDAECTQITMNGGVGAQTPSVTSPAGNREIVLVPPTYTMDNTNVNTCYGVFYDSGGSGSNYADNETYTKTFCSDNGENLRFDFTYFDVQNTWDRLRIYNGANTSATLIGTYTTTVPVNIISSGTCLTFEFESDCCTNKGGWAANISCFDPGSCGTAPSAEDLCANAPLINSIDGICGTTSGYTADIPGNLQSEFCTGVNFIDGNSWLKFQADATSVELAIICDCPTNSGLEVAILETADCNTFTEIGCFSPFYKWAPGVFTASGLTVGNYYYLMVDKYQSGPGCDFQINGLSGVVLPISLAVFNAQCTDNVVELSWITESEVNNEKFLIERSADGINFETIGETEGAGNSSKANEYVFVDDSYQQRGNYYRLKQVDFDGTNSYSDLVYESCEKVDKNDLQVYPNPFNRSFTIKLGEITGNSAKINIVDMYGRVVFEQPVESGKSIYEFDLGESISCGTHLVRLITEEKVEVKKITKH